MSQSALMLPNHTMQSQMHELAKTLPPPRKQNTACDACRSRKVKCNRLPGQEKCQHCLSKNYPCTHYVQQATSEKKKTSSSLSRRPRNLSTPGYSHRCSSTAPSNLVLALQAPVRPGCNHRVVHMQCLLLTLVRSVPPSDGAPSPTNAVPVAPHALPLLVKYGFYPPITLKTPTREVLTYVFAPPENAKSARLLCTARNVPDLHSSPPSSYAQCGELAQKLEDDAFRAEFALDLVEVFFQIVHTRMPLLNPEQFRSQLHLQPGDTTVSDTALHPALVATVIAWGAKFSEHPLLGADRQRPGGQSLLAKTLIDRARDLAEALKVHRIPSPDHVIIGLLLEPLQSQNPEDPNRFHCFWISAATRHLLDLQVNHKSVLTNISADARGTMVFAFWMATIADAYGSVYYRHKSVLDDDDYDIDFYTVDPISSDAGDSQTPPPNPREQLEFLGYYRAAHALARIARQMSRNLWRPSTDADGVPFDMLYAVTTALSTWRDEFLNVVGVPTNFEGEWDFVSAVSSCASDATYHVMWVVLFTALDDFGVKEVNEVTRVGQPVGMIQNYSQIELVMKKVADEALHGALRISGLAHVLTSNGYLRLDPAVMLVSVIQSGHLLARLGRQEVSHCIAGLEQYSYSYEEAGDQALEIRRTYNSVRAGELELQHMSVVAPRLPYEGSDHQSPPPQSQSPNMVVDEPTFMDAQIPNEYAPPDYSLYSR
ncbi:hypothetical protein MKEN_00900100 [Mycena kentingensis (nom. inval.)]|nr:hypothetical protein MKEN_00900100 [Mycena kentingensis (nom. inval.)]